MNYIEKNPLAFIESLKKLEEHTSKYGKTLLQMKYCDIIIGLLSIISMVFALIDNELYSSKSLKYINNKMEKLKRETWTIELVKTLAASAGTTVAFGVCGYVFASLLKLIPGVGTIIGGIINKLEVIREKI